MLGPKPLQQFFDKNLRAVQSFLHGFAAKMFAAEDWHCPLTVVTFDSF
jgi:hypothetical protein